MEELNWEYEGEDEEALDEDAFDEDAEALEESSDPEAFYKTLKIALQIQAEVAAQEIDSGGQFGVGQ